MNTKHRQTLEAIFIDPVRANIRSANIETLFASLAGADSEGRGSRMRVTLNRQRAVFHRPHPSPNADMGDLRAVRRFLRAAGQDAGKKP